VIGESKWHWFKKSRRLRDFGLIDDASRGPFGSAKLLCRIKAPPLALVGAFVTVVALAVDPFAQNILAVKTCQILSSNETAYVPTADIFNNWLGFMPRNENPAPGDFTLWGIDRLVADPAMKASVFGGLYGGTTSVLNASAIRPYCPGVSCTFPRYTTLGVCHRCADISSHVEKTCDLDASIASGSFKPPCKYALPNGQSIQSYAENSDYFINATQEISINFAVVSSSLTTVETPSMVGTFTNMSILTNVTTDPRCTIHSGNNCGTTMGAPTMELQTLAVECSLFPCARTYETSSEKGVVVEIEVKRSFGEGPWLSDQGDFRQALLPDDIKINPNENCTSKWPYKEGTPPPCTYAMGSLATMSLGNFFWSFWNGTMAGPTWGSAASTNDVLDVLLGGGFTNFTHIDRVLNGIADSMTAAIRLTGRVDDSDTVGQGGGQGDITGQVFLADTCIDVRWGWLALPAAVSLFTLLLLLWVMLLNLFARDQSAWKSSALPVLLHGLDSNEMASRSNLATTKEMEDEAKTLIVRLAISAGGILRLEPCVGQETKDGKEPLRSGSER